MKFDENSKAAKKKGIGASLTQNQQKWVDMQRLIIARKPLVYQEPPKQKVRRAAYYLIKEWGKGFYFDFIVLAFILGNIVTMGMTYEGSTDEWDNNLTNINYMFTAVFVTEASIKITAFGFKTYISDGWNQFDAFVIVSSMIDILISILGTSFSFLRIGPQIIRVIRVLRVTRLFKLVRKLKGIQKILEVLWLSMPAILNLLSLLFLVYFIFSVLAVFLFQNITGGIDIDTHLVNFQNFGIAMLTLFRCSTGEDWYKIAYDTRWPTLCADGTQNCGQSKIHIDLYNFKIQSLFFFFSVLTGVLACVHDGCAIYYA